MAGRTGKTLKPSHPLAGHRYLGQFRDEHEAAMQYDQEMLRAFGTAYRLNFSEEE